MWLVNELFWRGSVVSESNAGLCSMIKVTCLQGKMPQHDKMTKGTGSGQCSHLISSKNVQIIEKIKPFWVKVPGHLFKEVNFDPTHVTDVKSGRVKIATDALAHANMVILPN